MEEMNGLALCSGVGGLDLGLSIAEPGYRTVCYVEGEAYAAAVLVARMEDQSLDQAPVWSDLRTFDGRPWRGKVDIVTAGFPCQPVSVAGKRKAQDDERWLWPAVLRVLGAVRPEFVFLENVRGIITAGLGDVLGGLAALGFDAEWTCLRASDVGASHRRERWFCLAYATDIRFDGYPPFGRSTELANAESRDGRLQLQPRRQEQAVPEPRGAGEGIFPPGPNDIAGWREWLDRWPGTEPAVRRGADGLAHRVDRLRACGNGVVPLQAAVAYRILKDRLNALMEDD